MPDTSSDLHRRIGPREEILRRFPPADVERTDALSSGLHPVEDHLLELWAELGVEAVEDRRLDATVRRELHRGIHRWSDHAHVIARAVPQR